ncbi:hypothetical protein B0H15DRAFT_855035 [Mycena belliarum]|uniref:Uncharacterized protein n=1 Tax=Mycena belliarum TaxID=1033014 RepID=A0AAD6U038_9AGAR|nr:hypothetical protein B0H15DRAFT_855035 [Mycena belliae]
MSTTSTSTSSTSTSTSTTRTTSGEWGVMYVHVRTNGWMLYVCTDGWGWGRRCRCWGCWGCWGYDAGDAGDEDAMRCWMLYVCVCCMYAVCCMLYAVCCMREWVLCAGVEWWLGGCVGCMIGITEDGLKFRTI